MVPLLIAQPTTQEGEIKRPSAKRIVDNRSPRLGRTFDDSPSDDEKYLFKLLAWFFILLVLPAIVTLIFVALNPGAFMIDVTPNSDF